MKRFYIVLVILIFASSVKAQNMGIKGGLNIANLVGDSKGVTSKLGLHAGVFWLFKTSDKVGIMPEIVYSVQGAQSSAQSSVKINYSYINIPVMFNFYTSQNFFLHVGPQLGILTSAVVTDGKNSTSVSDQLNPTDFSLCFGLVEKLTR